MNNTKLLGFTNETSNIEKVHHFQSEEFSLNNNKKKESPLCCMIIKKVYRNFEVIFQVINKRVRVTEEILTYFPSVRNVALV